MRCPLCNQILPEGLDENKLQHRMQQLLSPAVAEERRKLEQEHRKRVSVERESARREAERAFGQEALQLRKQLERAERGKKEAIEEARCQAEKTAEREFGRETLQLRRQLERSEREKKQAIAEARSEAENTAARNVEQAVRLATRESETKLEKLETARERDRIRSEAERVKLQTQLDEMSRKLEKHTGEQLGQEAETDLLTQLKQAFSADKIEPIGRGVKGADIVQYVREDGKDVGRIVYESKNVSSWQNKFVSQAKRYQSQYDTPNVMIVTSAFPRKKKGLCVVKDLPVVEPRLAVALASILRDGILEVARLRITQVERERKGHQLFDYIVGDKFRTRFGEIADSVMSLREHQQKERDWHENAWESETKLHEKIDARRREIDSQIKSITRAEIRPILRPAASA
jgi:hypothetical protein